MKTNWRRELPSLLLLAVMLVRLATTWPVAPDRVPVHWNAAGEIDRYGSKAFGLLFPPVLGFGLYLQHVVGLEPCPMCIVQRYALVLVAIVAGVVSLLRWRASYLAGSALVAALALAGAFVAARQSCRPHLPDPLEEGGPARVGPGLRGEAAEGQLEQDDDRSEGQNLVAEGQVGEPAHGVLQAQVAEGPPDNSLLS